MTHQSGFRGLCHRLAPVVAALAVALFGNCARAERAVVLPAAAVDVPLAAKPGKQTVVFAGGCFWGVQAVFQHVKGVTEATSGYAGGSADTAKYDLVSGGDTGHAESVRVTFDPAAGLARPAVARVLLGRPRSDRAQSPGARHGTQYRSAVFFTDAEQKRITDAYVAQLDRAKLLRGRIVTEVVPLQAFYPAERYHQNYATLHPNEPYIVINDAPKVANLRKLFPALYRAS